MSAGRFAVIALAVVAVIVAISVGGGGSGGGGDSGSGGGGGSKPAKDALVVSFVYSPEKEVLIAPLVEEFNRHAVKVDGRPVFVRTQVVSSGEAQRKIGRRQLRPVVWSPASSLWGRLLQYEADQAWVPKENPSLARTPLVIAMWEPLARALGWPKRRVGFEQILQLALSPEGWKKYGKPQFGQFKLGHTNPDFSTSGLSAVAAEYYAATGKREGLTTQDVERDATRAKIRSIERSIVHYGDTTLFFADQMLRFGPAYASAVAMEEATLIDFNRRRGRATKLIGLYPAGGTFFSDNPFIVLEAPWVDAAERRAAGELQRFLAQRITAQVAARAGFRSGDPNATPPAPIDAAHGADPREPTRVLSLPQPEVLARLRRAWREDRKPANVMLAVDVSGSMGEEAKLETAKRGLQAFFRQISPHDRIGMLSFDDKVKPLVGVSEWAQSEQRMRSAARDLFPGGQTAWLDATDEAVQAIQKLKDPTRINAVVMLTDGEDTSSELNVAGLRRRLEAQARSEGLTVRVYTIAYGSQANKRALRQIAEAAGGKAFEGDPKEIESVYTSISSFF